LGLRSERFPSDRWDNSQNAMADAYSAVLGGKLSLKTSSLFKGKKRKSKSKSKPAEEEQEFKHTAAGAAQEADAETVENAEGKRLREDDDEQRSAARATADDYLTPAQKRFRQQKQAQEEKRVKELVKKTHRERVEEFNSQLASMTEHNDIPRISAAGNG
jgi:protein FAM32A